MRNVLLLVVPMCLLFGGCTLLDGALLKQAVDPVSKEKVWEHQDTGETLLESDYERLEGIERDAFQPVYDLPKTAEELGGWTAIQIGGVSAGSIATMIGGAWWSIYRFRKRGEPKSKPKEG